MSVINRMLSDLERRGAPRKSAPASPAATAGHPRGAGASRWLRARAPLVLGLALVLVAAALWVQRWPQIVGGLDSATEPLIERFSPADRAPSGDAAAPATGEGASGERPRVTRAAYDLEDGRVRLRMAFSGRLDASPGYARSGERIALRLPAGWTAARVPGLPEGQDVFRGLTVTPEAGAGTRVELAVHPDARFDLAFSGDRLELEGRIPGEAMPEPSARVETDPAAKRGESSADEGKGPSESAASGEIETGPGDGAEAGVEQRDAAPENPAPTRTAEGAAGESPPRAVTDASAAGGDGASVRKTATQRSPAEQARRLERRARRALDAGELATARQRLRAALDLDPDRHEARELLVRLVLRAGATGSARNLLAEGIARAPQRPGFAKPYARLLVDAGALEEALRVLERAAPAARGDAGYHALVAAVAQRLDLHERAARAYTRALSIDSGRGLWWLGLGISLSATERPQEAVAAFREARASGDLNEGLANWVSDRIDALSRARE